MIVIDAHAYIDKKLTVTKCHCCHQWCGRLGFNPSLSHTKDSKNGTWCYIACCPVGWGCKIHQHPSNKCHGYDTKQPHGEVKMILEFRGMRTTHSLPSLPGLVWPGAVVPNRALSMVQIQLNCILMNSLK